MKDYELPDPKTDPLRALVISFKTLKGIDYDDRTWDKVNFGRCTKSAKLLLDVCRGFEQAERCLSYLAAQFEEADLAWTFETILKHSHDWMSKNGAANGTNARKRLFDAIAKRRAEERATSQGKLTPGREILAGLRDMQIIQSDPATDQTGTRRGHVQMPRALEGKQGQRQSGHGSNDSAEDSSMGGVGA